MAFLNILLMVTKIHTCTNCLVHRCAYLSWVTKRYHKRQTLTQGQQNARPIMCKKKKKTPSATYRSSLMVTELLKHKALSHASTFHIVIRLGNFTLLNIYQICPNPCDFIHLDEAIVNPSVLYRIQPHLYLNVI